MLVTFNVARVNVFNLLQKGEADEENMLVNHSADKTDNSVSRMSYDELIDYVARTGNIMPTVPTTQDLMNSKYVHFLG